MIKKITFWANPFILYSITWIIVFAIYQLGWSKLCPDLTTGLLGFLLITIILSLFFGLLFQSRGYLSYYQIKPIPQRLIKHSLIILYVLFFIEIIFARGIPLLSLLLGDSSVLYTEFGLPFIHVIVVNGLSVVFIISFFSLKLIESKLAKRRLRRYIIFSIIPFILIVNRGAVMNNILGAFILTIILTPDKTKAIKRIIVGAVTLLFLFGLLGNLRTDANGSSRAILSIGRATDEFKSSIIPKEFFWSYLYIATPLANTQNTINNYNIGRNELEDVKKLILNEFVPTIISKRISDDNSKNNAELIVEQLNVSSVYGRIFTYIGWPGFYVMYLFMIFFIIINIGLVSKKSFFFVPTIVVIDEIIIMNLFTNMFVFMGLVPQIFILILLSKFYK